MSNETKELQVVPQNKIIVQDTSEFSALLDTGKFEQMWRIAGIFANSQLVPAHFQKSKENCFLGLQMAFRLGVDPMMLLQNTFIVSGRPGMESKMIIALINSSGLFEDALDYEVVGSDPKAQDYKVRAFAKRKGTGKMVYGPWIDWTMVKAEKWDTKPGSKWVSLPSQMFCYRAAAFFGRLHCPERLLGMQTAEELIDITPNSSIVSDISVPTSKTNILNSIGAGESILPAATETAAVITPAAEEKPAATKEKTTTKQQQQSEPPAEVVKTDPPQGVADTAAAEEVIPADKLVFMYLDELSRMTGETQDDLIDTYSKNKFGCLADLMGALNDKNKLTMAYLNDVLVPALKAKAAEVAEQQQEV